ncbi:MAG: AAA family ATPase [Chloroflexi bacterium]|nr:AAA family ATPase [Chloroflexota bacterium]
MPTITVSALITDKDRVLLVRSEDGAGWMLPGGVLTDADESVEGALAEALERRLGLAVFVEESAFLDTVYERTGSEVIVHNIFAAPIFATGVDAAALADRPDRRWATGDAFSEVVLPGWLREALPELLSSGRATTVDFDLRSFGVNFDADVAAGRLAPVVIVTGPAGAGKSTVSRALCARFARAAHINVDEIRWKVIVSGYVSPEAAGEEAKEARRQRSLATRNASALASNFAADDFVAVIDDVLEQPHELDEYLAYLGGLQVAFVTLLPDADTVRRRDEDRSPDDSMGERALELHRIISENGETRGLRLDTSNLTVEETVDVLLERLDEAWVSVLVSEE